MRIINAHILPMVGEQIPFGYIEVEDGLFKEVGTMSNYRKREGEQIIDANGSYALPGLIDAHSHLGMWENALSFEGDDGNESSNPITPHLRALDAINPLDKCFSEALSAGVTTVVVGPGSANPMGGSFVAMKTHGTCIDNMLITPYAAQKFAFGENPKHVYAKKKNAPMTRMAIAGLIREYLYKAIEYDKKENPDYNMVLESLVPVIKGEMLVKAHAHRADDIFTALRIAKEFNLKMSIEHCTDGQIIKEELAELGVCANVGPILIDRSKPELINFEMSTAGVLHNAGVRVAIVTDHPCVPQNLLMLCAAMAHREGLSWLEALKAITINAAKNSGLEQYVGSIEAGKHADLLLYADDPLHISAKPTLVLCKGVQV